MEESLSRRLRLLPLQAAVALGDWIGRVLRDRPSAPPSFLPAEGLGLSVVIPERGNPNLLGLALESLVAAGRELQEPLEVIVVVNGSNPGDYTWLADRYPKLRCLYFAEPLGFSQAVRYGLRAARFDWVYLANSDIVMDRSGLVEVLRWRAPHVFAVASQILPAQDGERRQETGWTGLGIRDGLAEIFDAEPEGAETRGTLYAGGGSSLFQKAVLARLLGGRDPYYPFYWEDVEWGARAWMEGFQVLFCPASKVWHRRRATVSQFFKEQEIEQIFQRNGYQFQLRNLSRLGSLEKLWPRLLQVDSVTFREITRWRKVVAVFLARLALAASRFEDSILASTRRSYHLLPPAENRSKAVVVVVSPYAIYPPSHGGAIRICQLVRRLTQDFQIVLLSDEADSYLAEAAGFFRQLAAVHLVSGRPDPAPQDRISRIVTHSHRALRQKLDLLLSWYDPALVDVEFIELALLISVRRGRARWLIALHDVLFGAGTESEEDRYERGLVERYDGAMACSTEDVALLKNGPAWLVPNGVDTAGIAYHPSNGSAILFAGPFRYLPNFEGIQRFLEQVYPRLLAKVPKLELWILGGPGAIARAQGIRCFRQRGVTIGDDFVDPRPFLERCALTINPLTGMRGSSIKLLESIAAGRVVVSTRDGARGFLEEGFPSLVAVETVADFLEPLERLLTDPAYRMALERPLEGRLEKYSWDAAALELAKVYGCYLDGLTSSTEPG